MEELQEVHLYFCTLFTCITTDRNIYFMYKVKNILKEQKKKNYLGSKQIMVQHGVM